MSLFYLDSSALVKRYRTEKGSEVMDVLFEEKTTEDRLATSFLTVIEITGVVVRLRRSNSIDERGLSELFSRFTEDQSQMLELFQISQTIQLTAVRISRDYGLRAADSIHLATMTELNSAAQSVGTRFIAMVADKAFRDAARVEGLETLDPEHDDALAQVRQFIG